MSHPPFTLLSSQDVSFSPDRQRITFLARDPKNRSYTGEELFLARFDGKYQRPLTHGDYRNHLTSPQFSPDGQTIVYTRWTGIHMGGPMSTNAEIWVVNADGSGHRRVIGDLSDYHSTHSGAVWSREGKRIFYYQTEGDIPESTDVEPPPFLPYSVAPDGSDARPVTDDSGNFLLPGISPDGRWRVTDSQWDTRKSQYTPLMLHDLENQTERPLTDNPKRRYSNAHWSADSQTIAFDMAYNVYENNQARAIKSIEIIQRDGTQHKVLLQDADLIAWLK